MREFYLCLKCLLLILTYHVDQAQQGDVANLGEDWYIFQTNEALDYQQFLLTSENLFLRFKYKGCGKIRLALESNPTNRRKDVYNVLLHDTSTILRGMLGEELASSQEAGLVSCDEFRDFWVKWENKTISAGRGQEVDQKTFISFTDESAEAHEVHVVSLAGGHVVENPSVYWIRKEEVLMATAHTKEESAFDELWITETKSHVMRFGVKGCRKFLVSLSTQPQSIVTAYEVMVSTSTSYIQKTTDTKPRVRERTEAALSCDEMRYFWISFYAGEIRVGRGLTVGDREFMRWADPHPHEVNAFGITGNGQDYNEWKFFKGSGYFIRTKGKKLERLGTWIDVRGLSSLSFEVKACSNAHVLLSDDPFEVSQTKAMYSINLGTKFDNDVMTIDVSIKDPISHTHRTVFFNTNHTLKCQGLVKYWLRWSDESLMLGKGDDMDDVIFSESVLMYMTPVVSAHLSASEEDAEWLISHGTGRSTIFTTYGRHPFDEVWQTVFDQDSLVFQLSACSSAYIVLSTYIRDATSSSYQIVLGAEDNTVSMIGKDTLEGRDVVKGNTPDILSCRAPTYYWVHWGGSMVRVGKGMIIGEQLVISYDKRDDTFDINALSCGTDGNKIGVWLFGQMEDYSTFLKTLPGESLAWFPIKKPTLVFQLKAERDAIISLHDGHSFVYDLILGASGNKKVVLASSPGGNVVASVDVPHVLSNDMKRSYWLEFSGEQLRVGLGQLHEGMAFNALVQPMTLRALKFSSDVEADWSLPNESLIKLHTGSTYSYDRYHQTVKDKQWMLFSVKSCNDAHIALSSNPGFTAEHTYEIVLGGASNKKSFIRNETLSASLVSKDTPGILSCDEYREFWISWEHDMIEVGTGTDTGRDMFMNYAGTSLFPIHGLAVSTGWGAEGDWELNLVPDGFVFYRTPPKREYQMTVTVGTLSYMELKIEACDGALISMQNRVDGRYAYEVAINKDSAVITNRIDSRVETVTQPDLLTCTDGRWFWVSWKDGHIQLGRGRYPHYRLLSYQDPMPMPVTAVSLWSIHSAGWTFHAVPGVDLWMGTSGNKVYDDAIFTVTKRKSLTFSILMCSHASVALSEVTGITGSNAYEFLIGYDESEPHKTIRLLRNGELVAVKTVEDVVDCEVRKDTWISWADGLIQLGAGSVVGNQRIIVWKDSEPLRITTAAFASGIGNTATWMFNSLNDDVYSFITPGDSDYNHIWMVPQNQEKALSFGVAACQDANILLFETPQIANAHSYEISLGTEENSKIVLKKFINGQPVIMDEVHAFGIIHCSEPRLFWVGWADGLIRLGEGGMNQHPIIEWQDPDKIPSRIRGVSVSNGASVKAKWKFKRSQVSAIGVETIGPDSDFWLTNRNPDQMMFFTIRACSKAILKLSENLFSVGEKSLQVELTTNEIKITRNGSDLAKVNAEGILACDQNNLFWVDWNWKQLKFGKGPVKDEGLIGYDDTGISATALAFASPEGTNASWFIVNEKGNAYTVFTDGLSMYNYLTWMELDKTRQNAVIRVKACSNAKIILKTTKNSSSDRYELTIGEDGNTRSSIIRITSSTTKPVATDTPELLSCNQMKEFYISWEDGVIAISMGHNLDYLFISLNDPEPLDIKYLSVRTIGSLPGEWQIPHVHVDQAMLHTPDQWGFNYAWTSTLGLNHLVVGIRACSGSQLALGLLPLTTTVSTYQIIIGGWGNTKSVIRTSVAAEEDGVVSVQTPDILACDEIKMFWIGWSSTKLSVGYGKVPFKAEFMGLAVDHLDHITNVGFSTGFGSSGDWFINTSEFIQPPTGEPTLPTAPPSTTHIPDTTFSNSYTIFTNKTDESTRIRMSTKAESLKFSVKACSDIHVVLHKKTGQLKQDTYLIILGAENNMKTTVEKMPSSGPALSKTYDTPGILECTAYAHFTLTWGRKTLKLNQEGEELLSLDDSSMFHINVVSLGSKQDEPAVWKVERDEVLKITFETVDSYTYTQNWVSVVDQDHIVMKVQACADAHIIFSETEDEISDNVYEVALGIIRNTKSVIRESHYGGNVVTADTPSLLSCDEAKYFWFHWNEYRLQVGTGTEVGVGVLMQHTKIDHPTGVVAIAVSTGWGSIGEWEMVNYEGDQFTVKTEQVPEYKDQAVFFPSGEYIEFRIRACSDASVHLLTTPFKNETAAYTVLLGKHRTNRAELIDWKGKVTARKNSAPALDCDRFKRFWVSWNKRGIAVGEGQFGLGIFMASSIEPHIRIVAVGLAVVRQENMYDIPVDGVWQVAQTSVRSSVFNTPVTVDYSKLWKSVRGQKSVAFKVKACSDLRVIIAATQKVTAIDAFEVIIGGWDNTKSAIRDSADSADIATEVPTPDILSCTQSRWFWLSWNLRVLRFGTGQYANDNQYLQLALPFIPDAIGMTGSAEASWEFVNHRDYDITLKTTSSDTHDLTWFSAPRPFFQFRALGCSNAVIMLSQKPQDYASGFQVILGTHGNTRSSIFKNDKRELVATEDTPDIMQCKGYKDFWIKWNNTRLSVGEGELGKREFLSYDDSDVFTIHAISLRSADPEGAVMFNFYDLATSYHSLHFETPDAYDYNSIQMRLDGYKWKSFSVATCSDAHITLFEHHLAQAAYEFVFGCCGNMYTILRRRRLDVPVRQAFTPNITDCQEKRPFWISWEDGMLRAGEGNIRDEKVLLEWRDPEPLSIGLGSISTGFGSEGIWQFDNLLDNNFVAKTPVASLSNDLQLFFKNNTLSSNIIVTSCKNARILLYRANTSEPQYEIIVGAEDNTKTQIYRGSKGERTVPDYETMTPNILSCSGRSMFHVGWEDSVLSLASKSGSDRKYVEWKDPYEEAKVNAMVLVSGEGAKADWQVIRRSGTGTSSAPQSVIIILCIFVNLTVNIAQCFR